MSRGSREAISGILKGSMRDNYSEHGVEEYYRKVGATYRNPHFPGVRQCLFKWFNRWWEMASPNIATDGFTVFDMACGTGEVTVVLKEWWNMGQSIYAQRESSSRNSHSSLTAVSPRRPIAALQPPPLGPELRRPKILAADPYTSEAYKARTSLECSTLSFRDIAEGALPSALPTFSDEAAGTSEQANADVGPSIEMTICSFALHLVESPSELFALLWQLSVKCRWLIVLAPHKKPEIKDGWGWTKWDVNDWCASRMTEPKGEYLEDRVHCRIYRSFNIP